MVQQTLVSTTGVHEKALAGGGKKDEVFFWEVKCVAMHPIDSLPVSTSFFA